MISWGETEEQEQAQVRSAQPSSAQLGSCGGGGGDWRNGWGRRRRRRAAGVGKERHPSLPAMDPMHDLEVGETCDASGQARPSQGPTPDPWRRRWRGSTVVCQSTGCCRPNFPFCSRCFSWPLFAGLVGSREWEDRSIVAHDIGRAGRGSLCGEARRGTVTWPAERGISCSCSRRAITAGSWSSLSSSSQLRPGVVIVTCDCSEP